MAQETLNFIINIGGNAYKGVASLDAAMGRLNVSSSKTVSLFEKMGAAAVSLNNIYQVTQAAAAKVGGAIKEIFNTGSENELQKMNMVTLFRGNAEAAEDMFARISEYGKATVYDKAGLLDAQKTMMSFGISGETAFRTLKQIGDIAMGDKQKMQSLALAFSQATSAGKLQGQDLLQLINAGFNPLQTISEKTGKSMASLKEEMSKGQISAEMLAQAFTWATEEGSLFYNGAEKAGSTSAGRWNQLVDTFNERVIGLFNTLQPIFNACMDFATNFLEYLPIVFSGISSAISKTVGIFQEFAPIVTGVATAIGILTIACNTNKIALMAQDLWLNILIIKEKAIAIATNIWSGAQAILNAIMTANPIGLIIAGIAALVGAIVWVCSKITGWGTLWDGTINFMKYSGLALVDSLKFAFQNATSIIMQGLDKIKLGWYKFKEACGIGDSGENQAAIAAISRDVEARKKELTAASEGIRENAEKAKAALAGIDMGWKKGQNAATASTKAGVGTNEQLAGLASATGGTSTPGSGATTQATTSAIATGGTRNTNITIDFKNMVENMIFNGTPAENSQEIERNMAEILFRILNMAQSSLG